MKIEFTNYYYEIMTDFLAFSPNILEDLKIMPKDSYLNENYLNYLNEKFISLIETGFYPEEAFNNLTIFFSNINKKIKENDLSKQYELIFAKILLGFNKAKKNTSNDFYYTEYSLKYSKVEDLTTSTVISKQELLDSVRFDYITMLSLIEDDKLFDINVNNIYINDKYLLSIKKFLKESPGMFFNNKFKCRALSVLVRLYEEKENKQEDIIDIDKQLYKLLNISKTNNMKCYSEEDFLDIYYENIIKLLSLKEINVDLVDEKLLFAAYKYAIRYDKLDENVKYTLSIILLKNEMDKRDKLKQKKEELKNFLVIHNGIKEILNLKLEKEDLIENEISNMYSKSKLIKTILDYFLTDKNKEITEKVRESIIIDHELMDYLIFDKPLQNIDSEMISISIKKLYNIIPGIFEDNTIYLKTIGILKNNDKKTLKLIRKYDTNIYEV